MIPTLLSVVGTLAGLLLVSLSQNRHEKYRSDFLRGSRIATPRLLRLTGFLMLLTTLLAAIFQSPQLGALYWSAYVMFGGLLVTGLYSVLDRMHSSQLK